MTQCLRMPIRVLVKGASTVNWMSGMGGPRTQFTFPRAIEAALLEAGRPVEVRTISVPSERTSTTLLRWENEVLGFSPDVVILVYGHYETIHLFLPRWLERHANSLRSRPRPLTRLYRKHVLRPLWMLLARAQARADRRLRPTIRRSRPRNVAGDLEALIGHLQKVSSPLVYVFELLPPASRYQGWFPGMAARTVVMNEAIAAMIKRVDKANVRLFRTSEMVNKYADGDVDEATPDGFHYSPHLHKMIGAELGRDIMEWADTQDHLCAEASSQE